MMELEGIDLMFSDQEVMPMPIKNYRECMKERKDEMKNHKGKKLLRNLRFKMMRNVRLDNENSK